MATIVTRAGKGSPLTHAEVDANFENLNNGKVEASSVSAFGASLIDDADAATARTTLGLGTAATTASTDYAAASHTHTLSQVTDAGTAAAAAATDFATAAQGVSAETAFGWGDHSAAGYLTGIGGQSIKNLSDVYSSMVPVAGQVLTYDATNGWQAGSAAAGATGGGTDQIFWENDQTVTTNYTVTAGKNAMSAGPITIASGITVTVGSGDTWTVV